MLNGLRRFSSQAIVWPPIDYELKDLREEGLLTGTVLNAGSGWRDISHLIDGVLVNQDISWPGDTRTNVDIRSSLEAIPRPDGSFDNALCIAVLEHVSNPSQVARELHRVLKPGGHLIVSVPFLQPEHKIPEDYQRYTRDGLAKLLADFGFVVKEIEPVYTVYHSIHWVVYEWLHLKSNIIYKALRVLLLPALAYMAKNSTLNSEKVTSVFRAVAQKPI